jgi:hypothetical protein
MEEAIQVLQQALAADRLFRQEAGAEQGRLAFEYLYRGRQLLSRLIHTGASQGSTQQAVGAPTTLLVERVQKITVRLAELEQQLPELAHAQRLHEAEQRGQQRLRAEEDQAALVIQRAARRRAAARAEPGNGRVSLVLSPQPEPEPAEDEGAERRSGWRAVPPSSPEGRHSPHNADVHRSLLDMSASPSPLSPSSPQAAAAVAVEEGQPPMFGRARTERERPRAYLARNIYPVLQPALQALDRFRPDTPELAVTFMVQCLRSPEFLQDALTPPTEGGGPWARKSAASFCSFLAQPPQQRGSRASGAEAPPPPPPPPGNGDGGGTASLMDRLREAMQAANERRPMEPLKYVADWLEAGAG